MTGRPIAATSRTQPARHHIGQQLRAARTCIGLTQRDVAALTGITQGIVCCAETASRDVLLSTVVDVASAAGRHVVVAAEHHLPLLDLTAAEVDAIALNTESWLQLGDDPVLRSVLDKLRTED